MKVVFMGTPEFALPCLKKIIEEKYDVVAVVTKSDKPKGRGNKLAITPIKEYAIKKDIRIMQPEDVSSEEFKEQLSKLNADVFITCAYGKILPEDILNMTKYGCINVHASLLPKLRGSAPIQLAIINGETRTGITTMYTDKGIDTGDILMQVEVEISQDMSYGQLHDIMANVGAELLLKTLKKIEKGEITRTHQNSSLATYAKAISKEECHIDWNIDSKTIKNRIRAFDPSPGAYTFYMGKRMKVFKVEENMESSKKAPGTIMSVDNDGIIVVSKNGTVRITEIQFDSGKRMSIKEYLKGHEIKENEMLK